MWKTINIETLNICNLSCNHCPYSSMTRKKEIMDMALFRKVVDEAYQLGIRLFNLNIYGEPLLDPMLFERIVYIKDKGLEVQFTSNGTLLDEGKRRGLVNSGIDRIYFSFDGGHKLTYEAIREGADFKTVLANITNLSRMEGRPEIITVTVLQVSNLNERPRIKALWKGIADGSQFWPIDNRRHLGVLSATGLSWPCHRALKDANVLSNGLVSLCCLDYNGQEILGDAKVESLRGIWRSRRFSYIRRANLMGRRNLVKLCRGCELPGREKLSLMRYLCHI